jgi:hypothetical protein
MRAWLAKAAVHIARPFSMLIGVLRPEGNDRGKSEVGGQGWMHAEVEARMRKAGVTDRMMSLASRALRKAVQAASLAQIARILLLSLAMLLT